MSNWRFVSKELWHEFVGTSFSKFFFRSRHANPVATSTLRTNFCLLKSVNFQTMQPPSFARWLKNHLQVGYLRSPTHAFERVCEPSLLDKNSADQGQLPSSTEDRWKQCLIGPVVYNVMQHGLLYSVYDMAGTHTLHRS